MVKQAVKRNNRQLLTGQLNCVTWQLMCNQISAAGDTETPHFGWETSQISRKTAGQISWAPWKSSFSSLYLTAERTNERNPNESRSLVSDRRSEKPTSQARDHWLFPTLKPNYDWKHFQGPHKWFHFRSVKIRVNLGANEASSHATLGF